MGKQRYIMANLVYGQLYPQLWLDNQLKSLCDPTNLPALKERYDLEYVLFTDEETLLQISRHPNFMQLGRLAEINIVKMNWPSDADRFNSRYGILVQMLQQVIPVALEKKAWLSAWVADLVFAKHSLPTMLKHMERGNDAVFMVPIRSAADSVNGPLSQLTGAPTADELFELAYANLHHLWVASHWNSPMFSKFPYSMLWNSGTGLLAHNFGITPIVFAPNEAMRDIKGGIDSDLPGMCQKPYWCTDWTEAAVAGVEPLSNGHYPPFMQRPASIDGVLDWVRQGVMPGQENFLPIPLYYPSKKRFNADKIAEGAMTTALTIQGRIKGELYEPAKNNV